MTLRLAFVTGRQIFGDGQRAWTDAGLGRLIDELARLNGDLQVAASRAPRQRDRDDHALSVRPNEHAWLPWYPSTARSIYKHRASQRVLRSLEAANDVLVVQLPFPAPSALIGATRPRVYHVCADVRALVSAAHRRGGVAAIERTAGNLIWHFERKLAQSQKARVLTHGSELLEQFGTENGRAVVSSTLFDSEIASVPRRRTDDRFRVLYVGYLRRAKGIGVLLDAFETLRAICANAELHVVGAADSVDSEEIERRIQRLTEQRAATLVGFRSFGPELFQCYSDADVLVLPTLSEGTPRVLVEARAFGCPVIASRVGGIPTSVEDGKDGVLVPPGAVDALANALIRIARDPSLRQRLSSAGIERARCHTVGAFAKAILEQAHVAYEERAHD